jgi:hypothetical protein
MASDNRLADNLSANEVADVLTNTQFTVETLRGYQLICIAFELYRFISYFGKNKSSKTRTITTFTTFISGFPEYLNKINQVAVESPLVFLLRNLPNKNECDVANKLLPFLSSIES